MIIKHLIKKEFIRMRRNPFIPRLIFVFPIVIMCVMPWVMNLEVKNIRVAAVDNDRSQLSGRLVRRIAASDYFLFAGMRGSYADAVGDIERSNADIIIEIPRHYGRDIARGRIPQVLIAANAVNGTKGGMGASYLTNIINQNLISAAAGTATDTGLPPAGVKISTLYLHNNRLDYKFFMIPALMSILMIMLCGFLPALNIVGEKEQGTIEQMNVTPVSKSVFILAKLIPYWIIGMTVLTICFILAWLVYDITPAGNIPALYLISFLLALTFSGFGVIVSNYSDTMQQAMFVMWFFMVCMILLSGLFTPVTSMPEWAQNITIFNPVRHYIDAMRTVFVRGGSFRDILPQTGTLAFFATAADTWAIMSYKKNK